MPHTPAHARNAARSTNRQRSGDSPAALTAARSYGVAIFAAIAATGATLLLKPALGSGQFLLFFLAVIVSSIYGGRGPGLLTTVLAVIAADYFLIAPTYALSPGNSQDLLGLIVFGTASIITSSLSHSLRAARDLAAVQVQQLEEQHARLERHADHVHAQNTALLQAGTALEDARAAADAARRDAEAASRGKLNVLLMLNNALESPLQGIAHAAQSLELGVHGPVNAAQRASLREVHRNQRHVARLLADTLHFARLGAEHMEFAIAEVPVREVMRAAADLAAPQLRTKALQLDVGPCDPTLRVCADRAKLESILLALLAHAVRVSGREGRIGIECTSVAGRCDLFVRSTSDAPLIDDITTLFEPVLAANGDTVAVAHLGIDLPMSRALARAMGGDLRAELESRSELSFTLTLLRVASVAHPVALPGMRGDARGVRDKGRTP